MQTSTLWYFFLGSVVVLWGFLGLATALMFNRKRLQRIGHDADTIEFLLRDNRQRCLGIAVVIPLLELLAAGVVYLYFGEISSFEHFLYICMITLMGVLPFPVLDYVQSRKKHKKLVTDGGKKVVVDMDYRVWNLVFRPGWEMLSTAVVLAYFVWYGEYFNLAMLHLGLLWLLYLAGRGGLFLTGPSLSDLYQGNFLFMVINHLLVLFHLVRFVTRCCAEPGQPGYRVGLVLLGLLSLKLIYYFIRVPYFRRELARLTQPRASA